MVDAGRGSLTALRLWLSRPAYIIGFELSVLWLLQYQPVDESSLLESMIAERAWPHMVFLTYLGYLGYVWSFHPGASLARGVCSCGAWRDRRCMRSLIKLEFQDPQDL